MLVKIGNLFIDLVLKILNMELVIEVWLPLIIGIFAFRTLYTLIGKRD